MEVLVIPSGIGSLWKCIRQRPCPALQRGEWPLNAGKQLKANEIHGKEQIGLFWSGFFWQEGAVWHIVWNIFFHPNYIAICYVFCYTEEREPTIIYIWLSDCCCPGSVSFGLRKHQASRLQSVVTSSERVPHQVSCLWKPRRSKQSPSHLWAVWQISPYTQILPQLLQFKWKLNIVFHSFCWKKPLWVLSGHWKAIISYSHGGSLIWIKYDKALWWL